MPQLLIFPEGTCGNNQAVLTFKKGCFKDFKPIKIVLIKYSTFHFIPFSCLMGEMFETAMVICNWSTPVTIYEFEDNYDPEYLNLDPNDENAWKIYAEKVRDIFSKVL
jgi:hypothetical protein